MIAPYTIQNNLSSLQITELLTYTATDKDIQENTSDWQTGDGRPGRFSSVVEFQSWRKSGKTIYTLKSDAQELAGIIWFSEKLIDTAKYAITKELSRLYHTTLGIRLYGAARGRGQAKQFLLETIATQLKSLGKTDLPIWLEVHKDNTRALHLYKNVGFFVAATSQSGDQDLLIGQISGKL